MIRLAWQLAKAGSWARFALLAGSTAVVSGLLLVAVAILRLQGEPHEQLFRVVADPGTRGGVVFAAVLLAVPPLLLLDQAVRLGTATRERRLAGLRVAGATPGEVRRLGAIEVGIPTFVGAVLGLAVFGLMRATLGGNSGSLGIVPTTVSPDWWHVLAVIVGVSALGTAVGYRASRGVIATPLGTARRQAQSAPRPWGLGLLLLALPVTALGFTKDVHGVGLVLVFVAITLAIFGVMSLAPWVAYRVALLASSRAGSPARLLAAQRIVAEPRPAGRAAAAIGGIAMVAGGAGVVLANVIGMDQSDPDFFVSLLLVAIGLLVGLLIVTGSIAVHTVESLLDRKREVAFLAATGTPTAELERAQRIEAILVAVPMAVIGVLLGTGAVGFPIDFWTVKGTLVVTGTVLITLGLVWLASILAVRAVRPWARRAALPANLRTE